MNLKLKPIH